MVHRVHNFNAGPAALPLEALERAQAELLDYAGSGMSILEHSHRGKEYEAVHNATIALLTDLLSIPDTHQVLFLQGGGRHQFAMIPLNFLTAEKQAGYIVTGVWGEQAFEEAKLVGNAVVAASTAQDKTYVRIAENSEIAVPEKAAYVHYSSNETIHGVQYHGVPEVGSAPLVCDMSSDFLSKRIPVSQFGLIYATAQKNIGPSGVTVVVIRKDFMNTGRKDIPKIFRYATHAAENSLYNTPPTFAIYVMRHVLEWVKKRGGLDAMERENRQKADILYGAIDEKADFYRAPVAIASRSVMNVVFRLPTEKLEQKFLQEAKERGMVGLKGHRSVGGIRVSLYNATAMGSVEVLISFMADFAKRS